MIPGASQLNSFTDIFGGDATQENISPPISLPSSLDTIPESPTTLRVKKTAVDPNYTKTTRPLKRTGQHGEFRSVEEIDPKYRCLFTYPYFNLVQSRIIEDALYSDKSFVLCAPTGSGKTVAFEMAILQLLMQNEDTQYTGDFKIIYMAPVKAVCNERLAEWYPKLTKLGLLCIEVTGDTDIDFSQLKPYKVIITTPEKWDMLTRRWRDHRGLVEMIKLFLIDEVHILNDETRGPVLEAVVSRMKTIESAAQSAHRIEQLQKQYQGCEGTTQGPPRIRFVAVSATVSNPEDVADWLGTSEKPAVFYKFGDECRPVKLKRIVEGYPCAEGTSIFKFDLILNYKLWSIIQKYYDGKPTLIFCNTRKSVALTAETLSREITVSFSPEQKAKLTALASTLKNKKLQMLVMSGVGCHHAGLLFEERVNIERAFRERDLPILITTTTLAMGVNLPAHLVIIKNTLQYVNGAYQEYSISTVLQMVGRAGRPQFDTEATAVIMTRMNDKARYQSLVGGSEPLQSYLHKRIAENLNSETALGTVTDVAQCVEWLRSTFLYVRAAKDPKRYLALLPEAPMHLILKKIEELCVKAMNGLASSGLITMDDACCIESTEAGRLMSIFYLDVETMKNIMKIDGTENLERLLYIVCESHELSDMHLRVDERRCLNLLNRNNAAATIRFPMKGKITTRQMKLNCIIQAVLGCLPIPDPSLNQEAMKVMRIAARVCKCLVKYVSRSELVNQQTECFSAVLNSIILTKCVEAHLWENSPYVSKQLKGIGPTFSTLLASAGKTSFMLLEESHPRDLERIMNKGPPAGNVLRKQVSLLPKYQLTVTPRDIQSVTVQLILLNHAHLSENMDHLTAGDSHKSYLIVGDSENHLLLLALFSDKDLISVYDGTMTYEITRKQSGEHKIIIHCISTSIAGIDAQAEYLFQDLEPPTPRENDYLSFTHQDPPKKCTTKRQTNITDVFKERKRKSSDADITQSKEKKKRENALTEKLKALKESFSKTSKDMKTHIDKSANMSSKLLSELFDKNRAVHNTQSIQLMPVEKEEFPTVDLSTDITEPWEELTINSDDQDYIDDLQIDSILNNIETEITGQKASLNGGPKTKSPTNSHQNTSIYHIDKSTKNAKIVPKALNEATSYGLNIRKRKNIQPKSNFNFIDLIEKKADTENTVLPENNDRGLSDTIKCSINKFLKRAQVSNLPPPGMKKLVPKMDDDLPAVHVKSSIAYNDIKQGINDTNTAEVLNYKCDKDKTRNKYITNFTKVDVPESNDSVKIHPEILVNINNNELDGLTKISQNTSEIYQSADKTCNKISGQVCSLHNENFFLRTQLTKNTLAPLKEKNEMKNVAINSTDIGNNDDQKDAHYFLLSQPDDTLTPLTIPNENLKNVTVNNFTTGHNTNQVDVQNFLMPLTHDNTLLPFEPHAVFNNALVNNCKTESKTGISGSQNTITQIVEPIQFQNTLLSFTEPFLKFENNCLTEKRLDKASVQNLISGRSDDSLIQLTKSGDKFKNQASSISNDENKSGQGKEQNTLVSHGTENALVSMPRSNVHNGNKYNQPISQKFTLTCRDLDNCNGLYTNPDRTVIIQTNELLNYKPLDIIQTPGLNTNSHNVQHLSSRVSFYENKLFAFKQSFDKRQIGSLNLNKYMGDCDNQTKTHVNRYSYSATKVDVCTKNTPDHQLRITRKLKVDLDITEILTKEKIQVNVNNNIGNENVDTENYTQTDETKSLSNNETSEEKFENNKQILEGNLNETYNIINEVEDINAEDKAKLNHSTNEELGKPSIGNILQKYSKILVKSENNAPIINRFNKNTLSSATKTEPQLNPVKTRRPFKIRDIQKMNVALPCVITEASKFENFAPLPEPLESITDKINKTREGEEELSDIELERFEERNADPIADGNENSSNIESPNMLIRSLELEPNENIEHENMFNPKMLLQYLSTDSKDDVAVIIPPPLEFDDNAISYSPNVETDYEPENHHYNVCSEAEENIDISNTDLASSSCGSPVTESPREETWFLSRDEENKHATQRNSSPWIISQRMNSGLVSRRTRLDQFKFIRKKPFRPR